MSELTDIIELSEKSPIKGELIEWFRNYYRLEKKYKTGNSLNDRINMIVEHPKMFIGKRKLYGFEQTVPLLILKSGNDTISKFIYRLTPPVYADNKYDYSDILAYVSDALQEEESKNALKLLKIYVEGEKEMKISTSTEKKKRLEKYQEMIMAYSLIHINFDAYDYFLNYFPNKIELDDGWIANDFYYTQEENISYDFDRKTNIDTVVNLIKRLPGTKFKLLRVLIGEVKKIKTPGYRHNSRNSYTPNLEALNNLIEDYKAYLNTLFKK